FHRITILSVTDFNAEFFIIEGIVHRKKFDISGTAKHKRLAKNLRHDCPDKPKLANPRCNRSTGEMTQVHRVLFVKPGCGNYLTFFGTNNTMLKQIPEFHQSITFTRSILTCKGTPR